MGLLLAGRVANFGLISGQWHQLPAQKYLVSDGKMFFTVHTTVIQ
jgi:hypothetical protein